MTLFLTVIIVALLAALAVTHTQHRATRATLTKARHRADDLDEYAHDQAVRADLAEGLLSEQQRGDYEMAMWRHRR